MLRKDYEHVPGHLTVLRRRAKTFLLYVYCPRSIDPLLFALWLSRLQHAIGRGLVVNSKQLAGHESYGSIEVTTKGYKGHDNTSQINLSELL